LILDMLSTILEMARIAILFSATNGAVVDRTDFGPAGSILATVCSNTTGECVDITTVESDDGGLYEGLVIGAAPAACDYQGAPMTEDIKL
jgi:hypothetical protein